MRQQQPAITEISVPLAYLLCALGLLGLGGIHRFYLGRYISGFIYLCTGGLFGLGQIIDLFLIPSMVEEKNRYLWAKSRTQDTRHLTNMGEEILRQTTHNIPWQKQKISHSSSATPQKTDPLVKLLKAAAANNNVLSIGQAIILMELPPDQVKELLNNAVKQELAHIDNDLSTGAVRYYFDI